MLYYRQPFEGSYPISQGYGVKDGTDPNGHTGIDYECPVYTPILASEEGTVMFAGWDNTGYGNCVIIQHPDGNATLYAHLSPPMIVYVGQHVQRSQVIGYSGSSGNSTGYHLHFEARHKWNDYKSHFNPVNLPLHSMAEPAYIPPASVPQQQKNLKGADAFHKGEVVTITAPLGAKGFLNDQFIGYNPYPQGSDFYYTGETKVHNGYTYMKVIPMPAPVWIAVNDGDCQILDKA